jgi:hypothetical protein
MEKKHVLAGAVVLVLLVGFFAYPYVRLLQFKMDADKMLREDFGRFPTAQDIIDVDDKITAVAKKHGFMSATYKKTMTPGTTTGTAELFYFLAINATVDGKDILLSSRVDTPGLEGEFEVLEEAGITIRTN